MRNRLRRAVCVITSAALLSGCVSTQMGRIGADDGSDPCRAQVVALDSTGDFFGEDIIRADRGARGADRGGLRREFP